RRAEAEVRPLGDLRSLPAVRCDARVRRGDELSGSADLDGRAGCGDVEVARRLNVVPAKAGTQCRLRDVCATSMPTKFVFHIGWNPAPFAQRHWVPAFAGTTR